MKSVDWTKWSAIAEVFSSAAILLTLLYLAIQTQQNSQAIRAGARHTMIQTDAQLISDAIDNPSISVSIFKEDALTQDEAVKLQLWLLGMLRSREHQYFLYRDGLLDEEMWRAYLTGLAASLSSQRTRTWWELEGYQAFDPDFADVVTEYLSNLPSTVRTDPLALISQPQDQR
jgi:hypothetical protein